jgi:hypothetical protein
MGYRIGRRLFHSKKKKEEKGKKKLIGKESHERDIRLHFSRKFSVRAQTYRKFGARTLNSEQQTLVW